MKLLNSYDYGVLVLSGPVGQMDSVGPVHGLDEWCDAVWIHCLPHTNLAWVFHAALVMDWPQAGTTCSTRFGLYF